MNTFIRPPVHDLRSFCNFWVLPYTDEPSRYELAWFNCSLGPKVKHVTVWVPQIFYYNQMHNYYNNDCKSIKLQLLRYWYLKYIQVSHTYFIVSLFHLVINVYFVTIHISTFQMRILLFYYKLFNEYFFLKMLMYLIKNINYSSFLFV